MFDREFNFQEIPTSQNVADEAVAWLHKSLRTQHDDHWRFQLSVCLAEALNNIVEHSPTTPPCVQLGLQENEQFSMVHIRHAGHPIDHLHPAQLNELKNEGGRGLVILQQWVDHFDYHHHQGYNLFQLIKFSD